MSRLLRGIFTLILLLPAPRPHEIQADEAFQFGFGKADITPEEPLRLSGYGNRTEPFTGIEESLFARAMAVQTGAGKVHVLVTVDTIGLPGSLVESIARQLEQRHGLGRSRLVICFSHTHTAPHIAQGLTNIFAKPLTRDERQRSRAYTDRLAARIVGCVQSAMEDLSPGQLYHAEGRVTFAENRRVIKDGRWVGFGVNPDGPVDHTLPLLKIVDPAGQIRGVVFNYACHCTTFGGDHNRVNGDWAGYAARYVETAYPGAYALCTIGCGADANPPRDPNKALEFAQAEGQEILGEVKRLVSAPMSPITQPLHAKFGHATLPFDCPTIDELKQRLTVGSAQVRAHAHNMLEIHQRDGALPRSYEAPIQVWRFGDQLQMVFLSGEVVVDYALRLKREHPQDKMWVTAYANDLFAYVASERLRREGGYEVDQSMIYYNQPGPWAAGTEEIFVQRIHDLLE